MLRPLVAKIDAGLRSEKEEKEAKLAQNLRQADYDALDAKLTSDFDLLKSDRPDATEEAAEHALDMKYLRERQMWPGKIVCVIRS